MEESDEEEFVYPGGSTTGEPGSHTSTPAVPRPTPAQLESLYAAASSGDLRLLKKLFKTALESASVEPFSLANAASTRTGLTALHAAASRGFLDIVTWREYTVFSVITSAQARGACSGTRLWRHGRPRGQGRRSQFLQAYIGPIITLPRQLCIKPRSMDISPSYSICSQIKQMYTPKMVMAGLPCITRVQRLVRVILLHLRLTPP